MAKLFLDSTDTSYKVSNGNTEVFGANGDQAITIDGNLTGIVLDANVERVAFTGATTDYTYKQVGTDLEVYNSTGALVTKVGLQDDATGTQLTFANGTVDAKFAPSATGLGLTVGGQTVSATAPAAVTIPAANIDVTTYPITSPTFSVASVAATATEGSNAVFTVTLANPATTATTVKYALSNVDTTTSADYGTLSASGTNVTNDATTGTLTFAAGATTATVTLPVSLDSLTETTEGVSLTLSNPTGGAIVNDAGKVATVSFVDAPATTFTLTSTGTGVEVQEGQTITFTVTPNAPVNVATTLVLNVQGKALGSVTSTTSAADFEATPALTFAQGSTAAQTITLKVATDTAVEGREAYAVDVIDTTAYAARGNQVVGVITDKLPTLSLSQNVTTVNEGSTVTYTVTSDTAAPTGGITIPFTVAGTATSGTDYTALTASSITIAAGATTGSVTLTTTADTLTDGADETVIVTLGTATNASVSETAKTVTTTITDSSKALGTAEMTLTGATSVDEGSTVTYTVTLGANATTALSIPYTVTGTATSGTDYTGSTGTISVAAGAKTGTLTLTTTADNTTEGAETVIVTLGTVTGFTAASGQGVVTTTVNDTSVAVTGTTFTLTTATDAITGTAGNDTIDATIVTGTAASTNLNVFDTVNLMGGTDTVNINYANTVATVAGSAIPTLTNVEVVNVRGLGGNSTMDGAITPSLTTLGVASPLTASNFTVSSAPAALLNYTMSDITLDDSDLVVTYASGALTGTADVATVTVSNLKSATQTAAKAPEIQLKGAAVGSGFETVNIVSNSDSRVGAVTVTDGTNSTMTKLTISGAGAFKNFGTLDFKDTSGTIDASSTTSGVDLTVGTENLTITGGSGNDTITFATAGDLNASDSVSLGNGTDKIVIADTTVSSSTSALNSAINATSAEIVGFSAAATVDMSVITATKVAQSSTTDVALTVNKLSSTDTIVIDTGTNAAADLTAAGALGFNTVNLELNGTALASVAVDDVTLTSQSTVNIVSNGTLSTTANVLDNLILSDQTTVTITGTQALTVTNALANTAVVVNGSAMTGKLTITAGTSASSIVGGAADDSLTGGTGADTLIGSAGADTIKTGANATAIGETVNGGAGADAVTIQNADAGAGVVAQTLAYQATAAESYSSSAATTTTFMDTLTLSDPTDDTITTTFTTGVTSTQSGSLTVTTTAPTMGTTTVTASGFLVYNSVTEADGATAGNWLAYQDTDGDGIIEAGEFAVKIIGTTDASDTEAFSVTSGKLTLLLTGA